MRRRLEALAAVCWLEQCAEWGLLSTVADTRADKWQPTVVISLLLLRRLLFTMFTARKKIAKEKNAEPDVFEESVAQVGLDALAAREAMRRCYADACR